MRSTSTRRGPWAVWTTTALAFGQGPGDTVQHVKQFFPLHRFEQIKERTYAVTLHSELLVPAHINDQPRVPRRTQLTRGFYAVGAGHYDVQQVQVEPAPLLPVLQQRSAAFKLFHPAAQTGPRSQPVGQQRRQMPALPLFIVTHSDPQHRDSPSQKCKFCAQDADFCATAFPALRAYL